MVNCKDASASLAAGTALMMRHARISHTRDASALTKISVLRVGVLGTASSAMSRTSNFASQCAKARGGTRKHWSIPLETKGILCSMSHSLMRNQQADSSQIPTGSLL